MAAKDSHDMSIVEKGSPDLTNSGQASVASTSLYTAEEEKQVLRKVDLALLPGLTFLYLLSFLDRSNVGNAKLLGLMKDIGLGAASKAPVYNISLALYFLGYGLFEIPANIVLKKFNPRVWLPTLTVIWGITAMLQCLVKNEAGFLAARFFMGVSEAGLFPGIVFVFSMYYKRSERHWRVAVFFGGAALAGAFGGVLAWALGHVTGGGLKPWGWIFAIEGIFTTLISLTAYFWVPGYPRQATVFKDPLILGCGFLFHAYAFTLYSLSLFLPTIIAWLGYASWKVQLMTVPGYALVRPAPPARDPPDIRRARTHPKGHCCGSVMVARACRGGGEPGGGRRGEGGGAGAGVSNGSTREKQEKLKTPLKGCLTFEPAMAKLSSNSSNKDSEWEETKPQARHLTKSGGLSHRPRISSRSAGDDARFPATVSALWTAHKRASTAQWIAEWALSSLARTLLHPVVKTASAGHKYYVSLSRRQASLLCQLQTNASALNAHRPKFDASRSPLCSCGEDEMREHVLLNWSLYNSAQQHPVSCLTNRRLPSAADLLGNIAFREAVLDYLNATQ